MRRHLEDEDHVAEALDEIITEDLGGRYHEITAFLDLQVEIIGAALVIAADSLFAVAAQIAVIGNRINDAVIVDVETGDELLAELHALALLAEKVLLVNLGIAEQLLLCTGERRQQHKCNQMNDHEGKSPHQHVPLVQSSVDKAADPMAAANLGGYDLRKCTCATLVLENPMAVSLLTLLDYAGVALFAATGALAASRKQLDLIGFLFFAAATGVGGGTLRDLVLGQAPVFWVKDPTYLLVCAGVGIFLFLTAHRVEWRYRLLIWLDAVGLAAYSVMGAAKGLAITGSPTIAIVTGTMTATFGGILRDLIANEPSILLRPEIYVTAALAGAGAFTAAELLGLPLPYSSAAGIFIAFALRGGAIHHGWTLPRYRPRPGRPADEAMTKKRK